MAIALNIPASNGVGIAANVSALDVSKTFAIGGVFGAGESVVIEGTADPTGVNGWNGIASFSSPTVGTSLPSQQPTTPGGVFNLGSQPIQCVVAFMRVRRTSQTTVVGSPTVSVDSTDTAQKNFAALTVPAGSGVGPTTDVSTFGTFLQFTVDGVFGPTEIVVIEASQDGTAFDPIQGFTNPSPGLQVIQGRYASMRVRRSGVGIAQTIRLFVGACTASGPGGGTPNQGLGSQAAWFITPTATAAAPIVGNNDNDGTTLATAIQTREEFYRRMAGVTLTVSQVKVFIASDLLAGDIAESTIEIPNFSQLIFIGAPIALITPTAVAGYIAPNPAGNIKGQFTLAGVNFATLTKKIIEFTDGVGGFIRSTVVADLGANTAQISQPIDQVFNPINFTNGQLVNIYDDVNLGTVADNPTTGNIQFQYCKAGTFVERGRRMDCLFTIGNIIAFSGQMSLVNAVYDSCISNASAIQVDAGQGTLFAAAGGAIRVVVDPSVRALRVEAGSITFESGQGGSIASCQLNQVSGNPALTLLGAGTITFDKGWCFGSSVNPILVQFQDRNSNVVFANTPTVTGGTQINFQIANITELVTRLNLIPISDFVGNNWVYGSGGNFIDVESYMRQFLGVLAETVPRNAIAASAVVASGNLEGTAIVLRAGMTVTNLSLGIRSIATAPTLTRIGLYDKAGNLLASTPDQGVSWATVGLKTAAVSVPFLVLTTDIYYLAWICICGAGPGVWGVAVPGALVQAMGVAIGAGALPYFSTTGLLDLPNPATIANPGGSIAGVHWIAVS